MPRAGERLGAADVEAGAGASPTMLIGEVASATGLTQRTLRYYEEIGLLRHASRLEGGFRLYSEDDVARLRRIIELKRSLGFSLVEIKELLEMEDERREQRSAYHREAEPAARREAVARSLELARKQLDALDSRLCGLLELKTKTEERIGRYESELAEIEASALLEGAGSASRLDTAR
jgi:MerR family transcriptional regulator, repressor of the yfmOP operon